MDWKTFKCDIYDKQDLFYLFGKFSQTFLNCLLKMKFGIQFKSNMLHLMGIFTFSVLDQKYPFWANKICCFKWSLVPRLIRISWIRCWLSRFVWSNNTLFGQIGLKSEKMQVFLSFLIKMSYTLENFLYFLKRKLFLYFKRNEIKPRKKYLYFRNGTFLCFRKLLIFQELSYQAQKTKRTLS